ncbi:cytochrome c oxidase-assembly factor COX23, mitochondrial-like [Miscanthus floridulus]|uniref:cytochrome c oxidase-assembly factor COX23, mitochondrial-like n=1 Tax=Miscanthus floridulus TaxID=154761 RepID=UPI00345888BB
MATAQAASASPTYHRASPGTSPPQPPYPSAARIDDSACFPQYTASLKCLEANQDKSKCQQQFDDYKECKKKEREARLERNKTRSLFG